MTPPTPPISLALPSGGTLTVRETALDHGRLKLTVRGPHTRGTFIIAPEALRGGPVIPATVRVQYGEGAPHGRYYQPRDDEPVIHGVRIHGDTSRLDPKQIPKQHFLGQYATSTTNSSTARIPDAARARTEAVVRRLLQHWQSRPDHHALLHAAARDHAAAHAAYEDEKAALLEAEVEELEQARAAARRKVNALTGLIRRHQPPPRAVNDTPLKVPFADRYGARLGVLTVREQSVNSLPGRVVYTVTGGRVHGTFTVGPYPHGDTVLPNGISIDYGFPRSRFSRDNDHEPTVNGVRLHGGWSHSGDPSAITPSTPPRLPARVRTGPSTACSAPEATQRRASGVLRALALLYLARSDHEALRVAAGKERASQLLACTRKRLKELRAQQHRKTAAAREHRNRAELYRAVLTSPGVPADGRAVLASAPAPATADASGADTSPCADAGPRISSTLPRRPGPTLSRSSPVSRPSKPLKPSGEPGTPAAPSTAGADRGRPRSARRSTASVHRAAFVTFR
ncbi:hypothetical protein OG440_40080 (plasmid) [Streptomyces sp. NBC_00637]|uniref:hypothetical protein n=1 Tax=Streptomyces sp. NBC_00637 TaxID=2903667 RepID=UPI002F916711